MLLSILILLIGIFYQLEYHESHTDIVESSCVFDIQIDSGCKIAHRDILVGHQ